MPDEEALSRRLRAVERSLTDGDHDVQELRDAGELVDRVDSVERRLGDVEDRIAELEAATQALRGYVGNVRSVNEDVERRADAALAAVDRLEDRYNREPPTEGAHGSTDRSPTTRRPRNERDEVGRTDRAEGGRGQTGTPRGGRTRERQRRTSSSERQSGSETEPNEDPNGRGIVQRVRDALR